MENASIEQEPLKQKSPSNFKTFFYGFITCMVVMLIFIGIVLYRKNQLDIKRQLELDKYNKEHASFVRDSLERVNNLKKIYEHIKYDIHKFDSARATLRYREGDIVFLKPDSTKAVVTSIIADSTLCVYSYFLILKNKEGDPIFCERKEKLLY